MDALELAVWPPKQIRTERLVLRGSEARDRAAFVELLASPEVHTYLGGPRPRDVLERELPAVPERWPGSFVVERDGAMIGQLLLGGRRDINARPPRGSSTSAICSCRAPGGSGTRPKRARRHSAGSPAPFPANRCCSPPRPPTPARCVSPQNWASPRSSGSRRGTPSSGSACALRSRRPAEPLPRPPRATRHPCQGVDPIPLPAYGARTPKVYRYTNATGGLPPCAPR